MMDCLAIDTLPIAIKLAAQVIQAKQQIFQNDRTETEADQILNGSVQGFPVSLHKEMLILWTKNLCDYLL